LLILQNYLDAGNSEQLYSQAGHLLESPDFDYELAGAWLAGKDALETIRQYSLKSNCIAATLLSTLVAESDPNGQLRLIGELMAINPERSRRVLSAFLSGFSGNRHLF
jgi:hypothetical protein